MLMTRVHAAASSSASGLPASARQMRAMAGAALAAASPAVTYPCDLIGPLVYEDSVVERSLPYEDGHLRLSERPGFGIDLQERYR